MLRSSRSSAQTQEKAQAEEASLQTPVLIVGAGPTGLTTSILLSRAGVPSLLVEKHTEMVKGELPAFKRERNATLLA